MESSHCKETEGTELNKKLCSDLVRTRNHIQNGFERLIAAYEGKNGSTNDFFPLDKKPHKFLMDRGIRLIAFSVSDHFLRNTTIESSRMEAQMPVLSVGLESLLNGIHLKIDSSDFVDYVRRHDGKTPTFSKSMQSVEKWISRFLGEEESRTVELLLDTFHTHRNNAVHFAFHSERAIYRERLLLELCYELYVFHTHEDNNALQIIDQRIQDLSETDVGSITSDFEFDSDSILWKTAYQLQ